MLWGRLTMEEENEKQALVAEVLLGADFFLYFMEKTCTLGYKCNLFVC